MPMRKIGAGRVVHDGHCLLPLVSGNQEISACGLHAHKQNDNFSNEVTLLKNLAASAAILDTVSLIICNIELTDERDYF